MITKHSIVASDEKHISSLYKDKTVAETYIDQRLNFSWQRLLHETQVSEINRVIRVHRPELVLEIAPGPARLTVDVTGVSKGFLVEYSEEMLRIARERLKARGCDHVWRLIHGNAFELSQLTDIPDSFDFIYTFRFIRHFHKEDRIRLYKQIHSKLSKGGFLMFDVVNRRIRDALDAKSSETPKGALKVYDVTYTEQSFQHEMAKSGFEVIGMVPVIQHFRLQSWLSYKFDKVVPRLVGPLIKLIEHVPSHRPLEWITICRAWQ